MSESIEPIRKRDRAAAFAKTAGVVLVQSAWRILSRTATWAVSGGLFGGLVLVAWGLMGVYPSATWGTVVLVMLTLVAGIGGFGYVGWIRGLGRAGIYVGCERGMVVYLVDRLLDQVLAVLQKSRRVTGAMESGSERLENLPLQQWEERLTGVVADYLGSDDPGLAGGVGPIRRVVGWFRGFLVGRVKRYLLAIVRQEIRSDGSGGGVSVARVRQVGLEIGEEKVEELIEGFMQTHLLVALGATTAWFLLIPLGA